MGISSWSWTIHFLSLLLIFGNKCAVFGASEALNPFVKDQARVDFIQNPKSMGGGATASLPLGSHEYFVTVQIGTPKRNFTLLIDTGSDLTWLQSCSLNCYPQVEPMYHPEASSTYVAVPGENYTITYGDKTSSKGDKCRDTLTLPDSGTIFDFIFGLGHNTTGDFGEAAGMLGLSRGDLSLVSQSGSTFGQTFCYCLAATKGVTEYLLFGDSARSECQSPTFTPLLTHLDSNYSQWYFVNLVAITIGTKRLAVSSFDVNSNSPTTLLDSGTVITRLPPDVYSALSSEFKSLMSAYPLATPEQMLLDTCYDLTGHEDPAIPTMVMHFENADVELDPSGVVSPDSDSRPGVACLAFAANTNSSDNLIIIGNTQQRTVGVLYDVPEMRVGFKTKAC